MSTCVYKQKIYQEDNDKEYLKRCLQNAINQIDKGDDVVEFSFDSIEVNFDYNNDEVYVIVS